MLAIRMQRTGRKGHAMFRVIVQDSRRTPTSGKIVAQIGSYDPHQKTVNLDKEKAAFYLANGAQPSDRTARLLKNQGIKMPSWVQLEADKERPVRNADKRRSTRPAEPVTETKPVEPVTTKPEESTPVEPAEPVSENVEESTEAPETTVPEAEAAEPEAIDEVPAKKPKE